MNVYAVIATSPTSAPKIAAAVQSQFPNDYIQAGDMCWLVADALDVYRVSRKLGIWEPTMAPELKSSSNMLDDVIVIWAVSYWGRASGNVWAWIAQKVAQQTAVTQP